jgi:hypothetical protein
MFLWFCEFGLIVLHFFQNIIWEKLLQRILSKDYMRRLLSESDRNQLGLSVHSVTE